MQYQQDAGLESQYSFGSFNPEEDLQEQGASADPSVQDKSQPWGAGHTYAAHPGVQPPRLQQYPQHVGWDQGGVYQHGTYYPSQHGAYDPQSALHFGAHAAAYTYGYAAPVPHAYGVNGLWTPPVEQMAGPHRMPMVQGNPSQPAYAQTPSGPPTVTTQSRKLEIKPPHSTPKSKAAHQGQKSVGKPAQEWQEKSHHASTAGHQAEASSNITAQTHNAAELAVKQALQGVILDGNQPGTQPTSTSSGEEKPQSSSTSALTTVEHSGTGTSESRDQEATSFSPSGGDEPAAPPEPEPAQPEIVVLESLPADAPSAAVDPDEPTESESAVPASTGPEVTSEAAAKETNHVIPACYLEPTAADSKTDSPEASPESTQDENPSSTSITENPANGQADSVAPSEPEETLEGPTQSATSESSTSSKFKLSSPFVNGKESAKLDQKQAEAPGKAQDVKPSTATNSPAVSKPAESPAPIPTPAPTPAAPVASKPAAPPAEAPAANPGPSPAASNTSKKRKDYRKKELNSDMLELFRADKPDAKTEEPAAKAEEAAAEAAPAPVAEEEEDMDWEAKADDDIAELPAAVAAPKVDESIKRYSRDFLLNLQYKFTDPPKGLEAGEYCKGAGGGGGGFGDSRGRGLDRDGRIERQNSVGRDDRWSRDARGGTPGGRRTAPPEGLAPPDRLGGRRPSGSLDDRWARGQALPPRQSGPGTPARNMPALHKTENRWQAGKMDTEDPEETKKQKAFKGTLNKLTPDNFDKLSKQIVEVGITRPITLEGLIDQIFDKALIEVTFCELYANLCQFLHQVLPEFDPQEGDADEAADGQKRKITFRRLLLNKCQEEFEKGERAMEAVEAREAKEKQDQKKSEKEEGEITDDERAKKIADMQQAEEERKARRRALGNIQFIGHLYRQRMLTEKIMHSCIQKLLADANSPKLEDVECLCKLLATAGKMLDTEKNASFMAAYFSRIQSIRELPTLESRLKFMLQDIIDLRTNKWEARRKQEGPKKIEDVHREAQAEMQRAASGPLRGGPPERPERGDRRGPDRRGSDPWSNAPPAYDRGRVSIRRDEEPPRPLQRSALTNPTDFRPQSMAGGRGGMGGGEAGVSLRPQSGIGISGRSSRPSTPADSLARANTAPPMNDKPARALTPEELSKVKTSVQNIWEECRAYEPNTTTASISSSLTVFLKETRQGAVTTPLLLSRLILAALNTRGTPPEQRLTPLQAVLLSLHSSSAISSKDLETCFSDLISSELIILVEEFPKAPELLGNLMGTFLEKGAVQLSAIGKALVSGEIDAEAEDPPLVDADIAKDLLVAVLKSMPVDSAEKLWQSSGLSISKFLPSYSTVDDFMKRTDLKFLSK